MMINANDYDGVTYQVVSALAICAFVLVVGVCCVAGLLWSLA